MLYFCSEVLYTVFRRKIHYNTDCNLYPLPYKLLCKYCELYQYKATVSVSIVERGLFPYPNFHCRLSPVHEQAEKLGVFARLCFIPQFIIPKLFCKVNECVYVQEKATYVLLLRYNSTLSKHDKSSCSRHFHKSFRRLIGSNNYTCHLLQS